MMYFCYSSVISHERELTWYFYWNNFWENFMKLSKFVLAVAFVALGTVGSLTPTTTTLAKNTKHSNHKVTICHATNSATNPYVQISVNYNSIVRGAGHNGHHGNGGVATSVDHAAQLKNSGQRWGDIIPALADHNYAGKNLTTEGQVVLDNGCKMPVAPATPVKPNKPSEPAQPTNPAQPHKPTTPNKPSKPGKQHGKVTLCHATNSAKKPYVRITVSTNAVTKAGHGNHDDAAVATSYQHAAELKATGQRWGDFIPAIPSLGYAGLNLAQGKHLLENNCKLAVVAGDSDDKPKTAPVVEADPEVESEAVVSDSAAYTEEPRQAIAALPVTGGMNSLLVLVAGLLTAGVAYLAGPVIRRLAKQA